MILKFIYDMVNCHISVVNTLLLLRCLVQMLPGVSVLLMCLLAFDCCSALKDMSASERHFTSIHELLKNAVFMKQQIHYETIRRYCHSTFVCTSLLSLCLPVCLHFPFYYWSPWILQLRSSAKARHLTFVELSSIHKRSYDSLKTELKNATVLWSSFNCLTILMHSKQIN